MWTDASSYSQNDRERTPTCWEWRKDDLRVRVHRHLHYPADIWLLSCRQLDIDRQDLESREPEEAQAEALIAVHERALRYANATRPT